MFHPLFLISLLIWREVIQYFNNCLKKKNIPKDSIRVKNLFNISCEHMDNLAYIFPKIIQ